MRVRQSDWFFIDVALIITVEQIEFESVRTCRQKIQVAVRLYQKGVNDLNRDADARQVFVAWFVDLNTDFCLTSQKSFEICNISLASLWVLESFRLVNNLDKLRSLENIPVKPKPIQIAENVTVIIISDHLNELVIVCVDVVEADHYLKSVDRAN